MKLDDDLGTRGAIGCLFAIVCLVFVILIAGLSLLGGSRG